MARPVKTRRICAMPVTDCFGPAREAEGEPINMTLEEYETIRLIDLQGLYSGGVRRADGGCQDNRSVGLQFRQNQACRCAGQWPAA